ncbi:CDP-glycerol glycerophosphotransferase family protein [Bacteroides thetaiotaomicron]|uniref:CDP-glycerol glycerophosphotransferase family protein n=1 Tax=Bacteroides thetaiotaomicron TaxID=818 RepID=UPI002165B401|nr:CDP-glycerol glycerophosphotransferase family protein [Bacteroides thetaiotaomicron]MCS2449208.1 CDP-glycerol glycerophosphotransferase family protein [Bacteroides thetaiotaomicron]
MNTLKFRVHRVRQKKNIRVLFAVAESAIWKNDCLYKAMLEHPRFTPLILILPDEQKEASLSKEEVDSCFDLFCRKGYACSYPYKDGKLINIRKTLKPDIIFYQKPYKSYPPGFMYYKNMNALFCYTNYAFHSLLADWANENAFLKLMWQNYYENESAYIDLKRNFFNVSSNVLVTGLPVTDLFLNKKHEDKWKKTDKKCKRIIWAPHFSISDDSSYLKYSTFLSVAEEMLEFIKDTRLSIQIAFKPHPQLKNQLYAHPLWGKEKTDRYYSEWECLPNAQLETGEYVDLFMTSDAMIHDCGSFTIEYHYTLKPVMYLVNGREHTKMMNAYAKEAYDLHYKGKNMKDIRSFIENVISERSDYLLEKRKIFFKSYLLPPNHQPATQNIIHAILGTGHYAEKDKYK